MEHKWFSYVANFPNQMYSFSTVAKEREKEREKCNIMYKFTDI